VKSFTTAPVVQLYAEQLIRQSAVA
jgi:hypothetical protein